MKNKKDKEETFLTLLQRIQRQYAPPNDSSTLRFIERPPDEAAAALGRQLALMFLSLAEEEGIKTELQEKALEGLADPKVNPAVIESFLGVLVQSTKVPLTMDWLGDWILHAEQSILEDEASSLDSLTSIVRAYAIYMQRTPAEHGQIANIYARLQSSAARIAILREFTHAAYRDLTQFRSLLSPLMAACTLTLQTPTHEAMLLLEAIWRESWSAMESQQEDSLMDILAWLTQSLNLYLLGLPCKRTLDERLAAKELAHRWLGQLLEMGSFLAASEDNRHDAKLSTWLFGLVSGTIIRLFAVVPSYRIPLGPLLSQIQGILTTTSNVPLDAAATLRLASLLLSDPIKEDVRGLLKIFKWYAEESHESSLTIRAILYGLGSIYVRDDVCAKTSNELIQALKLTAGENRPGNKNTTSTKMISSVIELLDEAILPVDKFIGFLSSEDVSFEGGRFSTMQQTGALLFGIGLLHDPSDNAAYAYLKHLLQAYPHLGISLLPVLVDSVNDACIRGDGAIMMRQLEFLCDAVVKDTQCAREIWNLLGVELMKETTPSIIRASMIRIFPKLCSSNKRLYKRIIETLGSSLAQSDDLEIRLAVATTICDLAREDRIRDVMDVIGWIQDFIVNGGWVRSRSTLDGHKAPGNAALVHFALLSLHYLIVAQEMDYQLVMVVLNKRLCNIHETSEVLQLPPLVLENLVLLLGDGEREDLSEEEEDEEALELGVPVQVQKSVETLICLATTPSMHPSSGGERVALLRCRRNIYESLANYSMDALGIDDEGVQAVVSATNDVEAPKLPPSGVRYSAIREIIENGIELLDSMTDKLYVPGIEVESQGLSEDQLADVDISSSLVALITKLLKFEEETLGSTLWQKRGKIRKNSKKRRAVDQSHIDSIPSWRDIQHLYNENRNTGTSLAMLLSFEGKPLSLFADIAGDIANDSSDPLLRALTVQAWLNAARSILTELVATLSSSEGLEQILSAIREWRFRWDTTDNMYMALSTLALYIPSILGPYGNHSKCVEEICDEVWHAYKDHEFEDSDIAKLCLGFIGVCAIRSRNMEKLDAIVDILENSVSGYGGQASFGAYYGLAVIAQSCPLLFQQSQADNNPEQDLGFTSRIIGFLVNELLSCISGHQDDLQRLVTCIREGTITTAITDSLTLLAKKGVKMVESKKDMTKSLLIAFALSFPALTSVNEELLVGVYCLLESLPWGSGKGMALSSVLHASEQIGLFEKREIEFIHSQYGKILEESMETGMEGLDDILYTVASTTTGRMPHSILKYLVGNRNLLDEDGRAVSLLAAVVSLSSLPCLGCGAVSFSDSPQFSPLTSSENVSNVVKLISAGIVGRNSNKYSQAAAMLMGFLASMKVSTEMNDASSSSRVVKATPNTHQANDQPRNSQLPVAQQGTVLEVVISVISERFYETNHESDKKSHLVIGKLVQCLEVLSLPGQLADFVEHMFSGEDEMKAVSAKLLISQVHGRPRAVFDGREFVNLALRITKMQVSSLRGLLGDAAKIVIEAFGDIVPKFSSESVEEVIENVWRLCLNQVEHFPDWTASFLSAMEKILRSAVDKKSFSVAPKTVTTIRVFLLRRAFSGIRDAPWTVSASAASDESCIIEAYASCLMQIPIQTLIDEEFFVFKGLDGFKGEALRNRCVMYFVRQGYFTTPSRASSEIYSALAWFTRQLVSSQDEIFSSSLLQVACSISEATVGESAEQKRELLLTLLDNLLMTGPTASYVGLQILGALLGQWCKGLGSDGDLSLLCLCTAGMERWQALSPATVQRLFRILVHDLPFNLANYSRREKLSGVVFNKLWRVYNKWWEQGADTETLECVKKALICCRSAESGVSDFASLATSMLL